MTERADLHAQLLVLLQHAPRDGFLRAEPVEGCTSGGGEHRAECLDAHSPA